MQNQSNLWSLARDYAKLADTAWLAGDWQCFRYWERKLNSTLERIDHAKT